MNKTEIERFIATCERWVGYKEKATSDYSTYELLTANEGMHNYTRFGRIADMVMNGKDKRVKDGFPWCAMFLISCLYESKVGVVNTSVPAETLQPDTNGIKFVRDVLGGRYFALKHMAGVANIYKAAVYLNRITKKASRGDFVIYISDKGNPYHIGVVVSVSATEIETIEGNTRDNGTGIVADGGCVARKRRKINKNCVFVKNNS